MIELRATLRLQLHKDFTLRDAAAQVPYLAQLGISHRVLLFKLGQQYVATVR